jgi:hypothetical protein
VVPRTTISAWRPRKLVRTAGRSIFPDSSSTSSRACSIVFWAKATRASSISSRWRSSCAVAVSRSITRPAASVLPLRRTSPSTTLTSSPSSSTSNSGAFGTSISFTPALASTSGPEFG